MRKLINRIRYKILGLLPKKWRHSPHDEWIKSKS